MDKEEVKQEFKQQGLPAEIKSAQRRRAMELSRSRMMDAVPTADVIVTNPSHYAVALKYESGQPAPIVVAKGVDNLAFKIREAAKDAGVMIVPDPPLARTLYANGRRRASDPRGHVPRRGAAPRLRLPRRRRSEGCCMNSMLSKIGRKADLLAAGGVVLIVAMLIIPLPPMLLDFFITLNISAALMIVVATMYVPRALDFSSFPTILLLTTLFRLAINVSVTRLILLEGDAGHVVEAFGNFVVGGNIVVGLVDLPDPDRDPVRRDHQRRRSRGRSRRPLHPRRHARQADGDRRRPQRGPDHRRGGAHAPRGGRPGGRLLRRDGRCLEVRQGRRDGGHPDHRASTCSAASSSASSSRACRSPRPATTSRCCRSATASAPRSRRC